ncbi:AAA family ATPase [Streptomyces sp. G1]|uniref:HelD family protein n=1 Tax=Streptomyces sp. G1 TaxID=361572 RepID=UPI0020307E6C|nr:AAA family ATPase [Streptomyces sp. G1]MCM1968796.1 AAA family ATPase [Streptomyces sp. G1]
MTADDPSPRDLLRAERAHHDHCRTALDAMVAGADEQVVVGEDVSASGADAEVLGYQLRSRAKEMRDLPEGPLFFGRLDFDTGEHAGEHAGQSYHVGRLRITEHPAAPPLVVDWRAPVSRAFYQASARDPQGVSVRRRFGWAPGSLGASADLTGLEDEHLARGETRTGETRTGEIVTSEIVTREIERPRVGPMRDIAATIQPEQDDLVRAGLDVSVCVQGAPGTGKTAVGLHRAAYLLYTHPRRIQHSGLLILGPNRTFLDYIAEVLPALGETGVRQSTLLEEIARHPVTGADEERTALVKHDARMAGVLRRALYARVAADGAGDLVVPDGSYRWRVGADELARIVREVRAEDLPYGVGRERVRTRIVAALRQRAERRAGPRPNAWVRGMAGTRGAGPYVDAVWPRVRPEEVLAELLTRPEALAEAADGVLDAEERKALLWARPPRTWKSARWSAADLVLLDELAGLVEHPEGYGHVVVDEAQDLSAMECRAIARRVPFGSLTVLGDLAQATTPWAARAWAPLLGHLGRPDAHLVPLTTGFRMPAAVADLANRLLARLDVDVPPARSLRGDGELTLRPAGPSEVPQAVAQAVRQALAHEGAVGVIAADTDLARLRPALPADPRVSLTPASLAKGLEYDHAIVVEPAAVAETGPRGPHLLYVALTRAVSRLEIVHSRELPF